MWSDNETDKDFLGYKVHADLLKDVVLDPTMLPISIGVFGDWGSGKSSLMLLMKECIDQWKKDPSNKDELVAQIQFNSWQFENYEDTKLTLIETVMTSIETHLKENQSAVKNAIDYLKKIKYLKLGVFLLKKIAKHVVPTELIEFLPTKEEWKKELRDDDAKLLIDEVSKGNASKFIDRFRDDFESIVEGAGYRSIIVYIDDLDRCEPTRIIQCLEAVKLFVNVRRTAFVIGADERIIEHAIEERYKHKIEKTTISSPYSDYMEKLIQLPYRIPRLSFSEQETYITLLLCSKLDDKQFKKIHQRFLEFRESDKHTKYDVRRIKRDNKGVDLSKVDEMLSVIPIMTEFLNGNPRQLKRFLNTLAMRRRMAKVAGFEDINPEVLVKLMVLEYNSVLRENIDDLYSKQKKGKGIIQDMADVEKQAEKGRLHSDNWSRLWNTPEAIQWLKSKPSLVEVNLQDYFWISREALRVETPVENNVSNVVRSAFNSLKKNQTVKAMKNALPSAIRNFTRDEKDMMVILLHQVLTENINSEFVVHLLDADENCEIVSSLSLIKTLFEDIDTTKLSPSYATFLKRMKSKSDCKKYVEEMDKSNSLTNALR